MSIRSISNCLLAICFIFSSYGLDAATMLVINIHTEPVSVFNLSPESLKNKSTTELEAEIGRKLTFREKLALKVAKRKWRKNNRRNTKDAREEAKIDPMAIRGFLVGVGAIIFSGLTILTALPIFFTGGIALCITAIIFSYIALERIKREPEKRKGRWLAVAGLVLGILPLAYLALIIGLFYLNGGISGW